MPIVPTNERVVSLLGSTGSTGPRANSEDFGSGLAASVGGLSKSIGQFGDAVESAANVRIRLENEKFVNDSMTRFQDYFSTWLADPKNHTDLNYDVNFLELARSTQRDYLAAAPNKMARVMLSGQLQNYVSSRYASAAQHADGLRTSDLVRSIQERNDSVIKSYTTDRGAPGYDPNVGVLRELDQRRASIDESLAKVAPQMAKKLKDQLAIDAAYEAMDSSPDLARKILDQGGIVGQDRHTMDQHIRTAENAVKSLNSTILSDMIDNRVSQAKLRARPKRFDIEEILPYTSRDQAQQLISRANAQIDAFNQMHDFVDKVRAWNGPAQLDALQKFEDDARTDVKNASLNADILPLVTSKVSENIRAYYRDPSGYMIKNNPAVSAAQRRIESVPPPPAQGEDPNRTIRSQYRSERDSLVLKYQNVPDATIPEDERNQHWVVPLANQRIVSEAEAEVAVNRINTASPNDALQMIMSEVQQHPGRESIAFNNLVHIPGSTGLRGDYWLIYKNQDNPNVKDLIGALQNAKQLRDSASSGDKMLDFEKAIDFDPTWRAFAATVPSDNFQNEEVVAGYRSGLITYALSQVQANPGMSPEAAIKRGIREYISRGMAPIQVGGQKMLIDRDILGHGKMTDEEAADLGRRLSLAPQFLKVEDIALEDEWGRQHFPDLREIGNEQTREAELRRYVERGYFKASADGRSATFYIRGRDGHDFEARDKQGRAFALDLATTPKFELVPIVRGLYGFSMGQRTVGLENPQGRPVIEEITRPPTAMDDPISYAFTGVVGTGQYRTNWPVAPKWLYRK